MSKKEAVRNAILNQVILPLYYHDDSETSLQILRAMYRAGVRTVEYTNRGDSALMNFRAMKVIANEEMKDLFLGIGTIKNKEAAENYLRAGADFIIAPSMNEEVGKTVNEAGLLWIPGCMTPTEIAAAENAGAELVKVFPGNLLGPSYLKSIRDLFPSTIFLVTGGVEPEEENLKAWLSAGARGVGMGSRLLTTELINAGAYDQLEMRVREALALAEKIKTRN